MLFVGDDWAEDHHDLEIEDQDGHRLARARLPEGLVGITRLHTLLAEHAPADWAELPAEQIAAQVVVGIAHQIVTFHNGTHRSVRGTNSENQSTPSWSGTPLLLTYRARRPILYRNRSSELQTGSVVGFVRRIGDRILRQIPGRDDVGIDGWRP